MRLESFAKSDKSTGMNDMKCLLCIVPTQAYKAFVLFYGAYEHSLLNGAATMYDAVKSVFSICKYNSDPFLRRPYEQPTTNVGFYGERQ